MEEPSLMRTLVYYANKSSAVLMVVGVAGIVIGAIARDHAPIPLIAALFAIGALGLLITIITKVVWRGMDVADCLRKK